MGDVRRVLDANANRAREALRVMEEAARFALEDAALMRRLKQLRHDLADLLNAMSRVAGGLVPHRDTPGDVGTRISTAGERQRGSIRDVAAAAGRRLGESLRCLEEYGKLIDPALAARFERLRYRAYDLERQLHSGLSAREGRRQWRLCVILTEALCEHHTWLDVARAAIDAGADCLQLREKDLSDAELLERVRRLVELTHERSPAARPRPSVIINDRADVALAAGAAGVHLGQGDLPPERVRRLAGPDLLIGLSTHNLREAARAVRHGADYCGVGAVFPTPTKHRRPAGPAWVGRFVRRFPHVPHLAIGGINAENVMRVVEAGARGVAVGSAVCGARKPATIVRKLLRAIPPPPGSDRK